MKDIADQEVIDLDDMDVEAFNEFATQQGWSDGMPLYIPTEQKVAKFVEKPNAPTAELCEAYVGAPAARLRKVSDAAHPVHANVSARAFAERVPFALSFGTSFGFAFGSSGSVSVRGGSGFSVSGKSSRL